MIHYPTPHALNQLRWLWLSLAVLFIDQASKWFVLTYFLPGDAHPVLPFFNLVLRYNTGAAFSMLGTAGDWARWFFIFIALGVSLFILICLYRLPRHNQLLAFSFALILGGALGNLVDRLYLGYVIDFFDFYLGTWHFATFNVADSAITVGAVTLLIATFSAHQHEHKEKGKPQSLPEDNKQS